MSIAAWWKQAPEERFWLEITNRTDLGANLKAPQSNEDGEEYWSYSLLLYARPGDIVFHYQKDESAIVASSVVVGEPWEDDIVWAARGSSAREAAVLPHVRAGWTRGLESFQRLDNPISLVELREKAGPIQAVRDQLLDKFGEPLYFPFGISTLRPLRPAQGYLTKFPAALLGLFPTLTYPAPSGVPTHPSLKASADIGVGSAYRTADEESAVSQRDPFAVDPALVERGIKGHAQTQNALAEWVKAHGMEPRSPKPKEPNYDVAWTLGNTVFVAEVKSLTKRNEEKQLRLGLGQVLRYSHLSQDGDVTIKPVLAVERKPSDDSWKELCATLNIALVWPGAFDQILATP